jgi:hypothetical protein
MRPVLKRIAINGLLTAAVLGLFGFLLAELAAVWLAGHQPARPASVESAAPAGDPVAAGLRYRLPFVMAGLGFGFILVCELALYAVRGNPTPADKKLAAAEQPDPAELLLEQLMAEADAAQAKKDLGVGIQDSGKQRPEAAAQNPAAPAGPGRMLNPES